MTVTIEWESRVISVPKVDTTLIQSVPTEIRELDMNVFRLILRNIEDSEEGIVYQNTHNHFAPINVGGVTLARVVELINSYTITFEDGQYAVNIIGGNSNIGDNVNVNQVSIRSFNSAGLVTSEGIEAIEYQNAVTIDTLASSIGTLYPVGTPRVPVDNLTDALTIAIDRGFDKINIVGDIIIGASDNIDGYELWGQAPSKSTITLTIGCSTIDSEFFNSNLLGNGEGAVNITGCHIYDLTDIGGTGNDTNIHNSLFENTGTALSISATATNHIHIIDCYSGVAGQTTPKFDINNANVPITVRNFSGGIEILNNTAGNASSWDFISGQIIFGITNTTGSATVRGAAKITDNSTSNFSIDDETTSAYVWDQILDGSSHNIQNSAGKRLRDIASQAIHTDNAQGAAINGNQIQLALAASTLDGAYDPSMITIIDGTGAGQTRLILEYEGSSRIATVDRNWKINPDATSEYIIFSHPGREHVNEGLAQGGTVNTITLNTLASPIDNAYVHQIVFLRSGLGEDQVGLIIDYNGTTKIATLDRDWFVIPDSTTGYVLLPTHIHYEDIAEAVWDYDISASTGSGLVLNMIQKYMMNKLTIDNITRIPAVYLQIWNDAADTILYEHRLYTTTGTDPTVDSTGISDREDQTIL